MSASTTSRPRCRTSWVSSRRRKRGGMSCSKMEARPTTPALTLRGIRKAFPGVVALDGVDFELLPGEVHILLGENGAGKSTLMKIISGAVRRDAGEISLHGAPVEITGPRHAQQLGIGIIYQELNLIPHLTAGE